MKKQREFKVHTECKTNGWTDLEIGNICSDPLYRTCSTFKKLIIESLKDLLTLSKKNIQSENKT